uniref:HECT domain-containing protein n=1 Tax=Sinocyclocheilus anshuiensis TaxID=1608454 RepID=A0A671S1Z3_9TELE
LASGYTGPIIHERKAIIDAIILHSAVRIIPMLQQVRDGLKLYSFHDLLTEHSETCQQLFVPGHFLLMYHLLIYNEKGSLRRHRECRIINFLQAFIQKLEDEGESADFITICKLFQWLTGQAHIPLIETQRKEFKIRIEFDHDCDARYGDHIICYPVINACAVSITFPTKHLGTYQEFQDTMSQAINNSKEFGRH